MKRSAAENNNDKRRLQKAKLGHGGPGARPCKNFPQRLLRVLESGIGTDTVWWLGEGKAFAVHTRNLKEGNMLTEHFKAKDYSVFIRNCNRWGFRRTAEYPVPQGVIAYQCSLFQKDEPHLIHHMRMDSDVQDIFVKHRDSDSTTPFVSKRASKAAAAYNPATLNSGAAQQAACKGLNVLGQISPEHLQVLQLIQGSNLPSSGPALTTRDPPAAASAAVASSPNDGGALQQLLLAGGLAASKPPPPPAVPVDALLDQLLQRIVGLTDEYLNHPNHTANSSTEPIRMSLQILKMQSEKYKSEKNQQHQQASNIDPLETLRLRLLAGTNGNKATTSTNTSMVDRVLKAEKLFQSANIATPHLNHQDPPPQDPLLQLLANNGIRTPQQPAVAAPAPSSSTLAGFLGLLQDQQTGKR